MTWHKRRKKWRTEKTHRKGKRKHINLWTSCNRQCASAYRSKETEREVPNSEYRRKHIAKTWREIVENIQQREGAKRDISMWKSIRGRFLLFSLFQHIWVCGLLNKGSNTRGKPPAYIQLMEGKLAQQEKEQNKLASRKKNPLILYDSPSLVCEQFVLQGYSPVK